VLLPGSANTTAGRDSALHLRDDDGWHMASVREWLIDPATNVSLSDIAWLVGDWGAMNGELEAKATYERGDRQAFLHGRYTLKRGDETLASGREVIARNLPCLTVGIWRSRFAREWRAGMEHDAPRGGRTPTRRARYEARSFAGRRKTRRRTPPSDRTAVWRRQ